MDTQIDLDALPSNVRNAVKFEASNRAHGSVHDDPFYRVSADTAEAVPGTLLKLEAETDTSLYTIAPSLSLSRFIYQSKGLDGTPIPVSAYILWPYSPAQGSNRDDLPVVAWSHGTSGVSAQCAPSNIRNLWHHFQVPCELALAGYVVVATDYAGLGVQKDAHHRHIVHQYLMSPALANDVIYSIQAVRQAFPQISTKFVALGSSLGGGSVWAVAEKMAVESVEGYLGTIALSPATSVSKLLDNNAYNAFLFIMLIPGIEINSPGFDRSDILEPAGLQTLETYLKLEGGNSVLFQLDTSAQISSQAGKTTVMYESGRNRLLSEEKRSRVPCL